jgi:hypothetical protein
MKSALLIVFVFIAALVVMYEVVWIFAKLLAIFVGLAALTTAYFAYLGVRALWKSITKSVKKQ